MHQAGRDEALDASIDVDRDQPTTDVDDTEAKPKDEGVVETLLKEGSDAPDAADIEDPQGQI